MFRGQFPQTIDAKGRVTLPARYREMLTASGQCQVMLVPALFDPCLQMYTMPHWEEIEKKVAELPSLDPHVVRFRRVFISAAIECEWDRSGRVLVPPHLRQHADLTKEILWVGMLRSAELWSEPRFHENTKIRTDEEQGAFLKAVVETIRI